MLARIYDLDIIHSSSLAPLSLSYVVEHQVCSPKSSQICTKTLNITPVSLVVMYGIKSTLSTKELFF